MIDIGKVIMNGQVQHIHVQIEMMTNHHQIKNVLSFTAHLFGMIYHVQQRCVLEIQNLFY